MPKGRKTDVAKESLADIEKSLTKEQKALIAKIRSGKKDPVDFAYNLLGVELHDGQKLWLWMTTKTQLEQAFELGVRMKKWPDRKTFDDILSRNPDFLRNILVPSNRWGKTLITSVKHLWYLYYKVGVRGDPEHIATTRCGTLNLSPHSNQCQASYDYILDILFSKFTYVTMEPDERAGFEGKDIAVSKVNKCLIGDFYVGDNKQQRMISFRNGTTFKAIPTGEDQASSLAGMRFLYISYDECAQSLHLKAELPAKIMSRLIDFGGPMDLVSTPEVDKPSHQYFFHIAKLGLKGEDGWFTIIGKLADNIFLGANEIRTMGDAIKMTDPVKYRQVVYGEFVTTGKKMFDAVVIERLWDEDKPRLPSLDRKYLIWADWGFSDTGDPTVFYVIDYTPVMIGGVEYKNRYRIAYVESLKGASPFAALARFRMMQREWNGARAGHDSGNMGGVMIRKMLAEMGMHDVQDFSSGGDKADMLFCLLIALSDGRKAEYDSEGKVIERNPDFGRIRSYHVAELEEQMGNYQYNPDKGISDKKLTQDHVMCLGMAIWWLERKYNKVQLKAVDFNPLADTIPGIFGEKGAKALAMHSITIPEKTIF
jgi:hypothetical protein